MIYVMSDIHNRKDLYDPLRDLVSDSDHLYISGDAIDRSEDGSGIDILLETIDEPNVSVLLGNHEQMMLSAFCHDGSVIQNENKFMNWLWNGGSPSFQRLQTMEKQDRKRLFEYLYTCSEEAHIRLENGKTFYLCHGWATDPRGKLWGRPPKGIHSVWEGDEHLVFGHTTTIRLFNDQQAYIDSLAGDHLRIVHGTNWTCIDTGCGHNLKCSALAMLRLDDMAEFYAV